VTRMEQFEQIRRDHAREELSIRELASRHGVHRRAVRQALESAIPPPKRSPESRPAPKLGPYRPVIDGILRADRRAPRKQRHTARRIWQRLVEEHGAEVSERQVCRYVHARRRELGEVGEVFVPLIADAGVEAEVDWGQAQVRLRGELGLSYLFISHDVAMVRHLSDRVAVMYLGRVVERGSWKEVLDRPRHPYTEALRDAVPVPDPRSASSIEPTVMGEVPDLATIGIGCAFSPRCPLVEEVCRRIEPPLVDIAPLHAVACHVRAREAGAAVARVIAVEAASSPR